VPLPIPPDDEPDREALDRVGKVLDDKWTLERLLGVGGMAAVYAGRHRNGARAAIKVLHPRFSSNKEVRERFRREGYAANKVEHPGAVKVLDDNVVSGGPDEGTAYLVMELLEGESLQDRLEGGHIPGEREFLELAAEVLAVLEAAHARGVVHRDLKPENLFFAREETEKGGAGKEHLKVLDFGLARLQEAQAITTFGLALGTPSFMSPEQAAGRVDEIDGRTDLFALAATGFRLRTGRRIHEAADPVELVRKMAQVPAPRIRAVTPGVSKPYARVIDRALEFAREDRYEDAAAMRADVSRALAELEPSTQPPAPAPVAPPPPRSEPTIELSEGDIVRPSSFGMDESVRLPKRRSLLPWLALLLLAGVGVKLWLDRGTGPDAPLNDASTAAVGASAVGVPSRAVTEGGAGRARPPPPQRLAPRPHISGSGAP
jgi:serine/threonine protein kinase